MTTNTRRVLYSFATLVFLVTAPLIVMFAQGYRIRLPGLNIYRTVSLAVQSTPRDADIVLDGKIQGKTPLTISGLYPGTYNLRIEKSQFQPWTTRLDFGSHSLTIAPHLAPALARKTTIDLPGIVSLVGDGRDSLYALKLQDDRSLRLYRFDIQTQKLFETWSVKHWNESAADLDISADGSRLTIVGLEALVQLDLSNGIPQYIRTVRYPRDARLALSDDQSELYMADRGTLWLQPAGSEPARVIASSGIRDVVSTGTDLVVLRGSESAVMTVLDKRNGAIMSEDFTGITPQARLLSGSDGIAIVQDGHNSLLLDVRRREITKLAIEDVVDTTFDRDRRFAILRSPTDVWQIAMSDRKAILVTRISSLIGAVRMPTQDIVLVLSNSSIAATDPSYISASAGTYPVDRVFRDIALLNPNIAAAWDSGGIEIFDFSR